MGTDRWDRELARYNREAENERRRENSRSRGPLAQQNHRFSATLAKKREHEAMLEKRREMARAKGPLAQHNKRFSDEQERKRKEEKKAADERGRNDSWSRTYGPSGNPFLRLFVPEQNLFSPEVEVISTTDQAIDLRTKKQVTLTQCIQINEIYRTRKAMRETTKEELELYRLRAYHQSEAYQNEQAYLNRWDMQVASQIKDVAMMAGTRGLGGVKAAFGIATSSNVVGQLANGANWDLRKVDVTDALIAGAAGAVSSKMKANLVQTVLIQEAGYVAQQKVNEAQGQEGAGVTPEGATAVLVTTVATYAEGRVVSGALGEKTRTISVVSGKGKRGKYGQYIPPTPKEMVVVDKTGLSSSASENIGAAVSGTTQEVLNPALENQIKDEGKQVKDEGKQVKDER